jgi:predicted unusual protein kinase regulating ubiquinone biosynthesis (AarF/ABC1/UbiB family)
VKKIIQNLTTILLKTQPTMRKKIMYADMHPANYSNCPKHAKHMFEDKQRSTNLLIQKECV